MTRTPLLPLTLIALLSPATDASAKEDFTPGPEGHALVIVDATVRQKALGGWYALKLRSGTLADSAAVASHDRRAAASIRAASAVDALAFVVAPGAYRPVELVVEGNVARGVSGFTVTLPDSAALPAEAAAGQVVYLGRIEVQSIPRMFKQNEYRFAVTREPEREVEVLQKVLKRARRSAWAPAIEARLNALGGPVTPAASGR